MHLAGWKTVLQAVQIHSLKLIIIDPEAHQPDAGSCDKTRAQTALLISAGANKLDDVNLKHTGPVFPWVWIYEDLVIEISKKIMSCTVQT